MMMKKLLCAVILLGSGPAMAMQMAKGLAETGMKNMLLQQVRGMIDQNALQDMHTELFEHSEDLCLDDLKLLLSIASKAVTWVDNEEAQNTILHELAVFSDDPELITFLLGQGASLVAKNSDGQTPKEVAEECGNDSFVTVIDSFVKPNETFDAGSYLLEFMQDIGEAMTTGKAADRGRLFKIILLNTVRSMQMKALEYNGITFENMAQELFEVINQIELYNLKALVALQPRLVTRVDGPQTKNTALHALAKGQATEEVIRFLVSQGADLSAKNADGHTPKDVAQGQDNQEFIEICEKLEGQFIEDDFDAFEFLMSSQRALHNNQAPSGMSKEEFDRAQQIQVNQLFSVPQALSIEEFKMLAHSLPHLMTLRDQQTGNTFLHRLALTCQDGEVLRFALGCKGVDPKVLNGAGYTARELAQNAQNKVMIDLLNAFEKEPWHNDTDEQIENSNN